MKTKTKSTKLTINSIVNLIAHSAIDLAVYAAVDTDIYYTVNSVLSSAANHTTHHLDEFIKNATHNNLNT